MPYGLKDKDFDKIQKQSFPKRLGRKEICEEVDESVRKNKGGAESRNKYCGECGCKFDWSDIDEGLER